MNNKFDPWEKYSQLTEEHLSVVANIVRDARYQTVRLHEPEAGDNHWSLGCRCYVRTCHALRKAADQYEWLTIPPEDGLCFTFAIGSIPFKFYHGEAAEPPDRYLITSWGELHQQQLALKLGQILPDRILRLAVETDAQTLEVSSVTLVEMDHELNIRETYVIPFDADQGNLVSIQPEGIDLSPVQIEPLKKEEGVKKHKDGNVGT